MSSQHKQYKYTYMQTHTHLAVLDKDNGLGNNLQSHFSFEDIYGETDHYSCNAPTKKKQNKNERQQKHRQQRQRTKERE